MPQLTMRFDLRLPHFLHCTPAEQYQAALDQAAWADRMGFSHIMVSEHHGAEDGYLPSPLVFLSAVAARTRCVRLMQAVLLMPLHHPLRVAEDVAVLDLISNGRVDLVLGLGYARQDFENFGVPLKGRGKYIEEGVEVLKAAWSGDWFEYQGRRVRVTPRPVQQPRPGILLGGNSRVAARRAARIADGFVPGNPEAFAHYREACAELGRETPQSGGGVGPAFLHIAENVEQAWEQILPHALHEANCYAQWEKEGGIVGLYNKPQTEDTLRENPEYRVVTPEECIELFRQLGPDGRAFVHPLMGGLDPQLAWSSLRLLEEKVLPAVR
ncbi:LLM class flavin-dependent oxidoreductase [Parahaliea mediterranea]|uniref:LLM class flavin-dependent oxidoreductase n=1 Tax=Parahaliea mediterranea TaxID=651086 RepID=A0A939IN27_9GAMM|nr:LLM class flavin-dependent oxidoreductase [Parahaliea mediterranea]MBN7797658.1 LLM class flavin-dependent oxidoreductase [Parahaliea mediterranea]